jgi:hypothetical protein
LDDVAAPITGVLTDTSNDLGRTCWFGPQPQLQSDLKNLFKGAAVIASSKPGPIQEFFAALLVTGMRSEIARLTLARKIATIVQIVWKRGACTATQRYSE